MENQISFNGLLWKGILLAIIGLLVVINPGLSVATLFVSLGILALVVGIVVLFNEYRLRQHSGQFSFRLAEGLVDVLIGIILIAEPIFAASVLLVMLGIWVLVMGIIQLYGSSRYPSGHPAKNLMLAGGIVTSILGILILANPFGGAQAIIILVGLGLMFTGIAMMLISQRLQR